MSRGGFSRPDSSWNRNCRKCKEPLIWTSVPIWLDPSGE
eukprot:gene26348-biopygen15995